jgi:hypothetical protein
MALGTWDPDAEKAAEAVQIDLHQLQQFIDWSREDTLAILHELISGPDSQTLAGLMHLDTTHWQQVAEGYSDEDLHHLVRFFTVAENLPGWEAGETSPVIPLAKVLRKRGNKLERDFLLWMRSVNNNRYLPYGPLV